MGTYLYVPGKHLALEHSEVACLLANSVRVQSRKGSAVERRERSQERGWERSHRGDARNDGERIYRASWLELSVCIILSAVSVCHLHRARSLWRALCVGGVCWQCVTLPKLGIGGG